MPAIHLARLNAETEHLAKRFDRPDEFQRALIELFEKYANWSFRSGDIVKKNIQIPQYHLPPIVVQKLNQAVRPQCIKNPEYSLQMAESFWRGSYLETRQFAISLITLLPIDDPNAFIDIIHRWLNGEKDTFLILYLLQNGCIGLRSEFPGLWLNEIENWLDTDQTTNQVLGLLALTVSANDPNFRHLPNVYRLSTQIMMTAPGHLTALLQDLVDSLILRSPNETSFFLQQLLLRGASKEMGRIVRKKLKLLPKDSQATFRTLLADMNETGLPDFNREPD